MCNKNIEKRENVKKEKESKTYLFLNGQRVRNLILDKLKENTYFFTDSFMLKDKIDNLITKKFEDIINKINGIIFDSIDNSIPGEKFSIEIDIYLALFDHFEQSILKDTKNEIEDYYNSYGVEYTISRISESVTGLDYSGRFVPDVTLLQTKNGTSYIEIFDNKGMIKKIIEYYLDNYIKLDTYLSNDKYVKNHRYDYIPENTDYNYKDHPRIMILEFNPKSYESKLLKERIEKVIVGKFKSLTNRIDQLLLEDIKTNPEKGLKRDISTRNIFYAPEDKNEEEDPYNYGRSLKECYFITYNNKEHEEIGYNETLKNPLITDKLLKFYGEKGINLELKDDYPGEYFSDCTNLLFDINNMIDDNSELFNTLSDIENIKIKKTKQIELVRKKELDGYIEKIDKIILNEACKFVSDNSGHLIIRANLIFPMPEGSKETAFLLTPGYQEESNIDYYDIRSYEYKFNTTNHYYNKFWKELEQHYQKNGFKITLVYDKNNISYKEGYDEKGNTISKGPYNYILIENMEVIIPNSNLPFIDTEDSGENRYNKYFGNAFGIFLILFVIIVLFSQLI